MLWILIELYRKVSYSFYITVSKLLIHAKLGGEKNFFYDKIGFDEHSHHILSTLFDAAQIRNIIQFRKAYESAVKL